MSTIGPMIEFTDSRYGYGNACVTDPTSGKVIAIYGKASTTTPAGAVVFLTVNPSTYAITASAESAIPIFPLQAVIEPVSGKLIIFGRDDGAVCTISGYTITVETTFSLSSTYSHERAVAAGGGYVFRLQSGAVSVYELVGNTLTWLDGDMPVDVDPGRNGLAYNPSNDRVVIAYITGSYGSTQPWARSYSVESNALVVQDTQALNPVCDTMDSMYATYDPESGYVLVTFDTSTAGVGVNRAVPLTVGLSSITVGTAVPYTPSDEVNPSPTSGKCIPADGGVTFVYATLQNEGNIYKMEFTIDSGGVVLASDYELMVSDSVDEAVVPRVAVDSATGTKVLKYYKDGSLEWLQQAFAYGGLIPAFWTKHTGQHEVL